MRCAAPAPAVIKVPDGTRPGGANRCRRFTLVQVTSCGSSSSSSRAAFDCSVQLASVCTVEQQRSLPLFADADSAAVVGAAAAEAGTAAGSAADSPPDQLDALATRFLDEQLLKAVTIVNLERDLTQEYNQVVLVGDAYDTRPFRLPWPKGTVIFCVAPPEVHQLADAAFKAQHARVPRGCLLRRVPAQLQADGNGDSGGFADALERAGFRGDRLSVWVLQGVSCLGLGPEALSAVLADVCNLAAFDSLVAGLLPPMDHCALDNLLASFGLLGTGVDWGWQTNGGHWGPALALNSGGLQPWLFVAQQKRLSLREMGIYKDHVAAAEEVGEDFEGNFS